MKDDVNLKEKFKMLLALTGTAVFGMFLCGCVVESAQAATSNKLHSEIGTNYFDKAIIDTPEGVIKVEVKKWNDYDDSDAIFVIAKDGTTYYTNIRDCVLIGHE